MFSNSWILILKGRYVNYLPPTPTSSNRKFLNGLILPFDKLIINTRVCTYWQYMCLIPRIHFWFSPVRNLLFTSSMPRLHLFVSFWFWKRVPWMGGMVGERRTQLFFSGQSDPQADLILPTVSMVSSACKHQGFLSNWDRGGWGNHRCMGLWVTNKASNNATQQGRNSVSGSSNFMNPWLALGHNRFPNLWVSLLRN